jgi:lipid II:glycine glycyltransferase (peptidoglycan interpeptide bridge formation enzyme)
MLAASNPVGREIKASYLMQWKIIEWLRKEGMHYYDLGGISPSTPGVNHFKAGLGGDDRVHVGLFEQCSNPVSSLFDRSLGMVKEFRKSLRSRTWQKADL